LALCSSVFRLGKWLTTTQADSISDKTQQELAALATLPAPAITEYIKRRLAAKQ
jgi:hypothetical protein